MTEENKAKLIQAHCATVAAGMDEIADMLEDVILSEMGQEKTVGGDDGTASNDDRTCPIAVQSPSITDELREYAMTRISPNQGMLESIADRIDEQFNRICSQHESVLQQTISETIDEHKCEMDELRAKLSEYESCDLAQTHRTVKRMLGEVKNLHDTLKARADAKPRITKERDGYRKLAKRNEQWCDALLDLIRDAAKEYQIAARVARRLQERTSELRRERDELQSKLQAISVLCEQDDGS